MNFGIKQIRKFPGRSVYNVNIFGCSEYLDALRRLIRMRVPQPMVARRPWSATVSCQGSGRLIACCCQGSAALCLPKDFSSKLHACYNRTQKPKLNKMLKKLCKVASPITINTCFKSSPIWIQIRCFVFAILWNGVSTLEKQNRFYDKVISKKKSDCVGKNRKPSDVGGVFGVSTVTCELGWKEKGTKFSLASFRCRTSTALSVGTFRVCAFDQMLSPKCMLLNSHYFICVVESALINFLNIRGLNMTACYYRGHVRIVQIAFKIFSAINKCTFMHSLCFKI